MSTASDILDAAEAAEHALRTTMQYEKPIDLTKVVYGGERLVTVSNARDKSAVLSTTFSMFAVSIRNERTSGFRDIMLCRRPELAKMIIAVLQAGEEIVDALQKEKGSDT